MAEVVECGEYGSDGSSSKRQRPAPLVDTEPDVIAEQRKNLETAEVVECGEYGSDGSSSKRQRKNLETAEVVECGEYGSDGSSIKRQRPASWVLDMIIDDKEILEMLKKDHRQRCEEALKHYRDTKGPDYELVELVKYDIVFMPPFKRWHYNFKAKNRAVNSGGGRGGLVGAPAPGPISSSPFFQSPSLRADNDDSPKLFYADFCETNRGQYRLISVMQCEILDPSGPVGNCRYCTNGVLHPTNLVDRDKLPYWMPMDLLPIYD